MPDTVDLRSLLIADVKRIYLTGWAPELRPRDAPALAEMAESRSEHSYDGTARYYGNVVGETLSDAIDRSRGGDDHADGLAALLGLDGDPDQRITKRRGRAARVLGYKNGEALRQSERQTEKGTKRVPDILVEEVAGYLVELATEQRFAYTGRFASNTEPTPRRKPTLRRRIAYRLEKIGETTARLMVYGLALLFAGVVGAAIQDAKGPKQLGGPFPNRPTYDYSKFNGNLDCSDRANPARHTGRCGSLGHVVLNSFVNGPHYSDETAFLTVRNASAPGGGYTDDVVVRSGQRLVLRIYIDNDSATDPGQPHRGMTTDARVKVALPVTVDETKLARAYVSAHGATAVGDTSSITPGGGEISVNLEYVHHSAKLVRHGHVYRLSDEIIGSKGALVGDARMNGRLSPCSHISGTECGAFVYLTVRVVGSPSW